MKILTEKDQLRNKLDELDKAIKIASEQRDKAMKRKSRKENWKLLSFIADEHWLLEVKQQRAITNLALLREYRDVINDRLLN